MVVNFYKNIFDFPKTFPENSDLADDNLLKV